MNNTEAWGLTHVEQAKSVPAAVERAMADLYKITGIQSMNFNTVYQMMAVLREHPEWRQKLQ